MAELESVRLFNFIIISIGFGTRSRLVSLMKDKNNVVTLQLLAIEHNSYAYCWVLFSLKTTEPSYAHQHP